MDMKLLAGLPAVATGIALSTLTSGTALGYAAPPNPSPPCVICQPGLAGPGGQQNNDSVSPGILVPGRSIVIPPTGGGPKTGGRSVELPNAKAGAPGGI
jgi:hypothetical protein